MAKSALPFLGRRLNFPRTIYHSTSLRSLWKYRERFITPLFPKEDSSFVPVSQTTKFIFIPSTILDWSFVTVAQFHRIWPRFLPKSDQVIFSWFDKSERCSANGKKMVACIAQLFYPTRIDYRLATKSNDQVSPISWVTFTAFLTYTKSPSLYIKMTLGSRQTFSRFMEADTYLSSCHKCHTRLQNSPISKQGKYVLVWYFSVVIILRGIRPSVNLGEKILSYRKLTGRTQGIPRLAKPV